MTHSSAAHAQTAVPEPPSRPSSVLGFGRDAMVDFRLRATWKSDLAAGLVVFLVALPLCLGVALASGAPLLSGIITGILGGLVVSLLSGSPLMVSGPAAGLTAIVLSAITTLGGFDRFLVAVVIAGGMQVALGLLRAGIIGYFFPSSVIRGMLAAIGLTLILKQLPYALGLGLGGAPASSGHGGNPFTPILHAASDVRPAAVLITILAIATLVTWPKLVSKKVAMVLPAPLVAVVLGVVGSMALPLVGDAWVLPPEAHVALPIVDSPLELWGMLAFPDWSALSDPAIWQIAVTVAIVASLETLLSLEATDKLDPWKRTSPTNRELLAQGFGNVLSGSLGGLPMTGVIVRSAANINAGGRTWRASWMHGAFLVLAVLALPVMLNRIPLAVLAAILLHTGFNLAHPRTFRDAFKVGRKYLAPFAITVVAILMTDLLIGIIVGLSVGAFFVLLDSWSHAYSYHLEESDDHHRVRFVLAEEVTFLNKARINQALQSVPPGSTVTVDASGTRHFDHDVIELLHDFRDTATGRGIRLKLIGVPEPVLTAAAH